MYEDLRDYVKALEQCRLLRRVKKQVDADWEIAAVCRVTFQELSPQNRPALLFENVKGYDTPVLAGALGGSRAVYAQALGLRLDDLLEQAGNVWKRAISHPLPPRTVSSGPCQENILLGEKVDLFSLPIPTWTVGQDAGRFFTAPYIISKDPRTGARNVGTYRLQIKGKAKTGIHLGARRHLLRHIHENEKAGRPTPIAVVVGAHPTLGLASVTQLPYESDELAVAGGLKGTPFDLVKCQTNDLEVPATAEFVVEGEIPPGVRETEGPFGEFMGYMSPVGNEPIVNVKCITHRNNPIYQAFVSQKPPSESSLIRGIGRESSLYAELSEKRDLAVTDVHFTESSGSLAMLVIAIKKNHPGQVWEAVWATWASFPEAAKITVVVDDDIDIRNSFDVEWAISFRTQPARDVYIERETPGLPGDPSLALWNVPKSERRGMSKMMIDATKKHEYPPLALPPAEHLAQVRANWRQYAIE